MVSAARTATENSSTITSDEMNGAHVIIDVTADPASASVVPTIQGYNVATGNWYDLLTGAALTAVGVVVLKVFPGAPITANLSVNDFLPLQWRVRMVHADADSITYQVSYNGVEI